MNSATEFLIGVAAVAVIGLACFYIGSHVDCFNFFGMAKGCVAH